MLKDHTLDFSTTSPSGSVLVKRSNDTAIQSHLGHIVFHKSIAFAICIAITQHKIPSGKTLLKYGKQVVLNQFELSF